MIVKIKNSLIVLLLLFCSVTSTVQAEDSKELSMLGKKFYVAFECSILASKGGNSNEQERLFLYGYETGKYFIESLEKNKIKKEDFSSNVPMTVSLTLQGPSADFILGRIFEVALEYALKDVYKSGDKHNSQEVQEIKATTKYQNQNCKLIGQ